MTLTIHKEEDDQRQLLLSIEVEEVRVEKAMRRTAKKLAKDFNVPGFRRGKAPYRVIVNRVGREALRAETIDEIVPTIFEEALADIDQEEIYGRPELTDMDVEPLVLKFTLPLQPSIELAEFREFRQEIEPVEISDDAVAEALERIREKYQELEEVDRALESGDMATLSGTGKLVALPVDEDEETDAAAAAAASDTDEAAEETAEVEETAVAVDTESADSEDEVEESDPQDEEEIIFAEERIDLPMDSSKVFPETSFVDNLLGLIAGDETSFSFTFPAEYENEELAGREASFELAVLNVQSRTLPELDDELAKREGDHETLAELEEETRKNLEEAATAQAKEELIDNMTDKLLEDAVLVYPPAAVSLEIDSMVENFKSQATRSGWEWEDFLQLQGITEEAMRDNFQDAAVERLRRGLVIRQFVLDEKLRVTAEDVDAALDEKVAQFDDDSLRDGMREYYKSGYGLDAISGEILHDKVHDRVAAIFSGNAPDLSEMEDEESAADEEE